MRPYAEDTNSGRIKAFDDIHHASRDCGITLSRATAKSQRHAARQQAVREIQAQLIETISKGD